MAVLILMVKHPGGTMAIRPSKSWKFHDFTNYFRCRLSQPHAGTVNFKYDISSYENCDLNNDDDWSNLILLTEMLEKQIVDVRCVYSPLTNNCQIDDHGSVVEAQILNQDDNIEDNPTNQNEALVMDTTSHFQEHLEVVSGCNKTVTSIENLIVSPQQKDVSREKHNEVVFEGCNNESRKKPRRTATTSENQTVSPQQIGVSRFEGSGEDHVVSEGCNVETCMNPRRIATTSEIQIVSPPQMDISRFEGGGKERNGVDFLEKPRRTVTTGEYPTVSPQQKYVSCLQGGGKECIEVESCEKPCRTMATSENQNASLQQKDVSFLSTEWVNNITHIGQEFDGGVAEFRTKLVQYAAGLGFHFDYVRNDGVYVNANCGNKKTAGCKWYVNGAQNAATRSFILKKGDLRHTCTLSVKSGMKRMGAHIIADMIQESVRLDPTICPIKVKKDLLDNYGFNFKYHQVWRGVEVARINIFGSYQDSCDELRWCSEAIKKTNPGSEVFLEFHPETRKFTRFFVAFKACIEGFKCCRPMLFVDGTFMETRYKGTLLSATAKDGNNGLFPVAFAIVDQENESNWTWFIEKLRDTLHHEQEVMYVSDRAGGLMSAFNQVFEKPLHFFCLYHLMKNLCTVYKGRSYSDFFRNRMCELLKEVAYAPNFKLFEIALVNFKNKGGEIAEHFLMDLPFERWAVAFNPNVLKYGELTSDATESFNNWILQARCLPVTYMIDCIRTQIMGWYVDRRESCSKWTGTLTPKMEEQWNLDFELISTWMIVKAPAGDYDVLSSPPVTVDLNAHTCSCYNWQVQGFPCCHAIAVINRECTNIVGFVDPCFFLSTYKLCYQLDISPVPTAAKFESNDLRNEDTILPPVRNRLRGKRKKNAVVEKATDDGQKKKFLCGRCGKYGNHYWTTCEEAIE